MSQYSFTLSVVRPDAFQAYMSSHVPPPPYFSGFTIDNGSATPVILVQTSQPLSADELTLLTSIVMAYVDPPYWLVLDHTAQLPMLTEKTNSSTPVALQSFIITKPDSSDTTVVDSIKTVVQYETDDVTRYHDWDSNATPLSVTFQIFCVTDGSVIVTDTHTVNSVGATFKQLAQNGTTGNAQAWETLQITGLKDKYPGEADCIWQYRACNSDSNIYISLNGLQQLHYNVE